MGLKKKSTVPREATKDVFICDISLCSDKIIHKIRINHNTAIFKLTHIFYITTRMVYCVNNGVQWIEVLL
jgi:hypothetical protein